MYRLGFLVFLVLLAACNQPTSNPPSSNSNTLGLLKVTITGIGDGATPNATAEWVKAGVSGQSATVVPVNGTNALGDVQLVRGAVNFSDDEGTSTRYIATTFNIINRSTTSFLNFTMYAVNVPGTTIGGTAIASMFAATGTAITSESIARGFQPIHAMRGIKGGFEVNPNLADLQFFTPNEVDNATDGIKQQAVAQGIIPNTATVLEYGYVARGAFFNRPINARNTGLDCTSDACKGFVTLAYRFPKVSPRQNNPFAFSLYFVVSNDDKFKTSQSVEEQPTNTIAGDNGPNGTARALSGSSFPNSENLCQVKTAVGTAANPSSVLLPSSVLAAPGSLDSCFGVSGKVTTAGASDAVTQSLAIQSDGKLVTAGYFSLASNADFGLARYNSNGSLDTSFEFDGKVATAIGSSNDQATSVAIQSDGKIVAAGYTYNGSNNDFALVRYNPNGSLDTTFDGDGKLTTDFGVGNDEINAIAIQPDGKIVVAGHAKISLVILGTTVFFDDFALARYNPNGTLDTTFGTGGKVATAIGSFDVANAIGLQSDGKIVVAGYSTNSSNNYDFALARYNPNGSLDTTFDADGKVTTAIGSSFEAAYDLAIQSDGKIVVAGYSADSSYKFAVARYNTNGSLDTTFDADGIVTTAIGSDEDQARALAVQSDGKIVVAGYSFNGGSSDFALVRYNSNGSLDTTFDSDGKVTTDLNSSFDHAYALAIQSDGKMVVAGYRSISGTLNFALTRYNP